MVCRIQDKICLPELVRCNVDIGLRDLFSCQYQQHGQPLVLSAVPDQQLPGPAPLLLPLQDPEHILRTTLLPHSSRLEDKPISRTGYIA